MIVRDSLVVQGAPESHGGHGLIAHRAGFWPEEYDTGTGSPKYFMIRYHDDRDCFRYDGPREI